MRTDRNELGAWLYNPNERRRRAVLIAEINQQATDDYAFSSPAALVNADFAVGAITFEQRAAIYTKMYGVTLKQQLVLEEAQRQSHASLFLEGFELDHIILLLNERVLIGEISMSQKLELIKQFYA